jgi:hypothetical protein
MGRPRFAFLAALAGAVAAVALPAATPAAAPAGTPGHVFVIVLENEDAATTFGPDSPAPYLAEQLRRRGVFVPNYYGTAHNSLPNYLAMISGQAPTTQTQADCPEFVDVLPGLPAAEGQVIGQGCVYPASVTTVADQLEATGRGWKGYLEDMGDDPVRDNGTACAHPALGTPDRTEQASPADQYATRHNPFVYFHSIIDEPSCAARDVPLSQLASDIQTAASTPELSFIVPDLCHDGHDATCADGGPGGLPAADAFLRTWVPRILAAPAFKDGLLVITFDEAETDASACCGEQPGPNTPQPGIHGPGGGRTGAVLISPFIKAATVTQQAYNHYGLLRSIEDAFGLVPLGYAASAQPFGKDIYSKRSSR